MTSRRPAGERPAGPQQHRIRQWLSNRPVAVRRAVRRTVRQTVRAHDPTPRLVARQPGPSSGIVCCVYRTANVAHVDTLVDGARRAGLVPRLWALDQIAPSLAAWTIGAGPGLRQELLNRLVAAAPVEGRWIVLADDDVVLADGRAALARLLALAERAGFDLAQPGHHARSHYWYPVVGACAGSVARRTGFVEVGPTVAIATRARDALLPLDERLGMGWGQDHRWARAAEKDGLRIGVVDAVRMRHVDRPGRAYDAAAENARVDDLLVELGYRDRLEPAVTLERWPVWRRTPPWQRRRAHQ